MGGVIVLGSLMTDLVARAPRLPLPGESLLGDEFGSFAGGKGCNQAVAAARLGASVALIGRVGSDPFGDEFLAALACDGVAAGHVGRDPALGTGVSCIQLGADVGQNAIVAVPRANLALSAEAVRAALRAILAAPPAGHAPAVFLAQCETSPASVAAGLEAARAAGLTTILNAAPVPREPLGDALLALVAILVVNETEAAALAGAPADSPEAARTAALRLLERGPAQVVVTLGAQGFVWARAVAGGAPLVAALPAHAVVPVDPTAAGDAFCGALAAGLAAGDVMEAALRRANAAGALAATRMGALPSLPTAAEVAALLAAD